METFRETFPDEFLSLSAHGRLRLHVWWQLPLQCAQSHLKDGARRALCAESVPHSRAARRAQRCRVAASTSLKCLRGARRGLTIRSQGHTTRFVVHDVKQFCDTVLPQFFQHANWSSFVRQLANYGFARVADDADDAFVFEHPLFARNQPASLAAVVRRVAKVAESEPDRTSVAVKRARASEVGQSPDTTLAASIASLHAKVDMLSATVATLLQAQTHMAALLHARASTTATALPSLFDDLDDIAGEPFATSFRNFPAL